MDMLAPDVVELTHDQPSSHEQELVFLCVPATDVPSERSFNAACATVTKLRARDNVGKLTFIHHSYACEGCLPVWGPHKRHKIINSVHC